MVGGGVLCGRDSGDKDLEAWPLGPCGHSGERLCCVKDRRVQCVQVRAWGAQSGVGGPGVTGGPWAGWCPWQELGLQLCAAGGLEAGRSWKGEMSPVGLEPGLVGVALCGLLTLPGPSRSVRQPPWGAPPCWGGGTPVPCAGPQTADLPSLVMGVGEESFPSSCRSLPSWASGPWPVLAGRMLPSLCAPPHVN